MPHGILASVASNPIELRIALLGAVLGAVVALAWESHREVSTLIIGFALAMSLGQSMAPWAESYVWLVKYRPMAAKPWYFLVAMVLVMNVLIPLLRVARRKRSFEVPWPNPR